MFTVFSKGLFAGAGGVYFQPQYDSDTLLALLSRTPKGEQRQLCLYKSWVIKGVFGSSTVQKEWSSSISIGKFPSIHTLPNVTAPSTHEHCWACKIEDFLHVFCIHCCVRYSSSHLHIKNCNKKRPFLELSVHRFSVSGIYMYIKHTNLFMCPGLYEGWLRMLGNRIHLGS